jgi:hypothetical protein
MQMAYINELSLSEILLDPMILSIASADGVSRVQFKTLMLDAAESWKKTGQKHTVHVTGAEHMRHREPSQSISMCCA